MSLERFRSSFRPVEHLALNAAGIARCSTPAIDAVQRMAGLMAGGTLAFAEELAIHEAARGSFATLVGADRGNVSMFHTCAAAISQVALGFPLRAGDEIVTWDQEYPSNAYPWHAAAKRAGGRVVTVESEPDLDVDTAKLIAAIGPKTRVVAVSWVQFQTGAMTDLAAVSEACRKVGAWLVVDAAQGLGVLPFDLDGLGVDVVCGATHKWLCGPVGHGLAAFAEGRRDEITPLSHGAMTYGTPDDPTDPARAPRRDPRRFEPGNPLMFGAAGGGAAADLALSCGVDLLLREALRLADALADGLRERGCVVLGRREGSVRSPIVTFRPRGDVEALYRALDEAKVSYARRAGGVRLSPHAYNTDDEIARVLQVVGGADKSSS